MRRLNIIIIIILCFSCGNKEYSSKYEDGSIKKVCELVDKHQTILKCREYYPFGVLKMEAQYKGDQLDGVRKLYDSAGVLKEITNYKEGKAEGLVKFYKGDLLLSMYEYSNDKSNGKFEHYNKDGSLSRTGYMRNGMKIGIHKAYDSVGNLGSMVEYKMVNGKSNVNQWWNLARDSTVKIEESHFATAEIEGDSVYFKLVAPFFEGLGRVLIGDFGSEFKPTQDTMIIEMEDGKVSVSKNSFRASSDTIRAIVQDYEGSGDNMRIKNIFIEIHNFSN